MDKSEAVCVEHFENGGSKCAEDDLAQQGAMLVEAEMKLPLGTAIKLFWKPLLISSISFTAAMMYGYDNIANGASIAMPGFLLFFGEIGPTGPFLPTLWTSLWTSMSVLFQAVGAFSFGFIQDRFGRKWSGVGAAALTVAGTGLQYVSHTPAELLGGKIINGFAIGAGWAVATTYASEVTPLRLKAFIQQGIVLFMVLMMAVALGIVRAFVPDISPSSFRLVFAIQWAVGGLSIAAFLLAPESPVYLITHDRVDEAYKSMEKIYGTGQDIDARVAFLVKTIREEEEHAKLQVGSYLDCFKGVELKRTVTASFIYTTQAWGGAAFLQQSIYVMIRAGLPPIHSFDISIGGFALSAVILVCSWFAMGLFRRRHAFLFGCVLNLVGMTLIGALTYAPGQGPLWAIAILMNLLIAFQTSLMQGMGYPIAAEVSSYRLRGKTLSIATIAQSIVNWGIGFAVPYIYNTGSANLGTKTGFIFMGFSVLLIAIAWFLIPDTTNMTEPEINHAYEQKVAPRKFRPQPHLFE